MPVPARAHGRHRPLRRLGATAALVAAASGALVIDAVGDPGADDATAPTVHTVAITPDDRVDLAADEDYLPELAAAFTARASLEAVEPTEPPADSDQTATPPEPDAESPAEASTTPSGVWDRLAQCESGQNWSINTGNGFYGGLQFTLESWRWVGGRGYPHEASRETQIAMAERLLDRQGWVAWPVCSAELGLR